MASTTSRLWCWTVQDKESDSSPGKTVSKRISASLPSLLCRKCARHSLVRPSSLIDISSVNCGISSYSLVRMYSSQELMYKAESPSAWSYSLASLVWMPWNSRLMDWQYHIPEPLSFDVYFDIRFPNHGPIRRIVKFQTNAHFHMRQIYTIIDVLTLNL